MIRTLLFVFVALACSWQASAQATNFGPFEWDIVRFGYALPSGDGVSGGITVGSEPRYNISDRLSTSLRFEFALFGGGDDETLDIGAAGSYVLFGDYYFSDTRSTRPFVGLGLGLFGGGDTDINVGGQTTRVDGGSSFGVVPRLGLELGHLRLAGEYNLPLGDEVSSYLGISLGLTLWGGLR